MKEEQLKKMLEQHEQTAERNYQNYQETGISRYQSTARRAEDIADALRIALNAAHDHDRMIGLQIALSELRTQVERMGDNPAVDDLKALASAVKATAAIFNL